MKKVFLILVIAFTMLACNKPVVTTETVENDSIVLVDTVYCVDTLSVDSVL